MVKPTLTLVILLLITLFLVGPVQSQSDLGVTLTTTPVAGQIGPDRSLVRTTLSVVDANGQAVANAYLKLRLNAPPGNPLISTDFPIVENTTLLSYEGVLPEGVLEFDYIYPIRGEYNFQVEAGRDAATTSFNETLSLRLSENPDEVRNGLIMLALLFALGLVAGLVIGNGARASRLATAGLILAVGLTWLMNATPAVRAQGGDHQHEHDESEGAATPPFTETISQGDLTVTYTMNPGAGEVGLTNRFNFAATDSSGVLTPDTTFEVVLWHIEDEKQVFATTLFAPTGQANLNFQFFDGAEHEVRVIATNSLGRAELNKVVAVKAINPPLAVKIKTVIYLVLATFLGALLGLRIQVIRGRKQELAPLGA